MKLKKKGVIFDLEGVICDTFPRQRKAWKAFADRLGICFDEKEVERMRGISRMACLELVLEGSDQEYTQEEKEKLAEEKNRIYQELLKTMDPEDLTDEVKNTLNELRARGYKLAVGSSSRNTRPILNLIGLGDFFDQIADGTDIARAKPDPEVFRIAAARLGLDPSECCVVEDAAVGIQAAKAGGFTALALFGDAKGCGLEDYDLEGFADLLNILPSTFQDTLRQFHQERPLQSGPIPVQGSGPA